MPEFPTSGRIAAVDYGTVRMGIAICDPDRILVSPLETVEVASPLRAADADYFRQLVRDERVTGFVVGLPIHCDGGESDKSRQSRQFARWLQLETGTPARLFDERFTTAVAKQRMRGGGYSRRTVKRRVDAIAALILLESFLEACHYRQQIAGEAADAVPSGGDALD